MSDDVSPELGSRLRVMRIIHAALLMGPLIFSVIVFIIHTQEGRPLPPPEPIISYVGFGFAGIIAITYLILPKLLLANWRKKIARGQNPLPQPDPRFPAPEVDSDAFWWGLYQVQMLIGLALLEGALFMQLIFYMVEAFKPTLVVAGVLCVIQVLQYPTRPGVESWIQTQRELVEREKRMHQ